MTAFSLYREIARSMALMAPWQADPRERLYAPPSGRHSVSRFQAERGDRPIPGVYFRPPAGTGATVVYVHGGGTADVLVSVPLFEALLDRGFGVVTFALDGFGENAVELAYPDCLDCLPAVLRAVSGLPGVDPQRLGLYGLCLGAAFALRAAREAPGVKALALVGTPLELRLDGWGWFQEMLGTFHPMNAPVLQGSPSGHVARTFFTPVRFASGGRHTLFDDGFMPEMATLIRHLDALEAAAALPPIPTQLVLGEWDAVVSAPTVRRLAAQLPGPVEVRRFPYRNHTTLLYDPEAAETSVDWFARWL